MRLKLRVANSTLKIIVHGRGFLFGEGADRCAPAEGEPSRMAASTSGPRPVPLRSSYEWEGRRFPALAALLGELLQPCRRQCRARPESGTGDIAIPRP